MSFFEKSKSYDKEKNLFNIHKENLYKLNVSSTLFQSSFFDLDKNQNMKIKKIK